MTVLAVPGYLHSINSTAAKSGRSYELSTVVQYEILTGRVIN